LTFVESVSRAVASVAEPVLLGCSDPSPYAFLGLDSVKDACEGAGPLGGIVAGLEALSGKTWVLVAACDLPFVSAELARALVACARKFPDSEVVLPSSDKGDEPLFALYKPAVARLLRSAAERGTFRLTPGPTPASGRDVASFALEGIAVVRIPIHELDAPQVPPGRGENALYNVNDPNQLLEARRIAANARADQGGVGGERVPRIPSH